MHLVKVPENKEKEMLNEFFQKSIFTFEGIEINDKKGMKKLEKALIDNGYDKEEKDRVWYWFNGSVMNEHFHLTGDNAYKDDLTFLCIPDFYNPMFKLFVGARWFDDILQSNLENQMVINNG